MPILECRSLSKRYGAFFALRDVSLSVEKGSIHAVLGENGAGKSTLMKLIAGWIQPDEGSIHIEGQSVSLRSPLQAQSLGIGMVHQHFTLVPSLTVLENWALAKGKFWIRPAQLRQELVGWAKRLGFQIDPSKKIESCSVGEQQRIEILKALSSQPKILILDEPSAVLAPQEVSGLLQLLSALRAESVAILLVTHKLAEVESIADEVTILRQGRLVAGKSKTEMQKSSTEEIARLLVGEDAPLPVSVSPAVPARHHGKPLLRFKNTATRSLLLHDLEIHSGECIGVAGVEGNGQEELCRLLAGLEPLTQGQVYFQDQSPIQGKQAACLLRQCVGHIPADRRKDGLALGLSVEENLVLRAVWRKQFRIGPFLRKGRLQEWAAALAQQFDIRTASLQALAWTLSGGNQQKIVLAREIDALPKLLLAAHPTRGLDIASTSAVRRRLLEFVSKEIPVVLVSTDLDEILELSNRIFVLSRKVLFPVPHGASKADIGALMVR